MTDAFRQAAAIAPVIAGAIGGSEPELDGALAAWARWRDRDAFEHHWMACDLGASGRSPLVVPAMMRRLERHGELQEFTDLLQHRSLPSRVFSPSLLLSTSVAMAARGAGRRTAALREVGHLMAPDVRRKRFYRKPVFVDPAAHADAGETELSQEAAA
ncbi:MAG: hypothetical protein JO039_16990 [Solirubrobacterales bacterium]|nr:hypothetical protein [Solirubrobacterales bacterium]